MVIFQPYTPKQFVIMEYLFKVRGANVHQILHYIKDGDITQCTNTARIRLYEMLRRMTENDIVMSSKVGKNESSIYYLTENGLDLMHDHYEIPNRKIGTGFNNNYGYFPYKLHRPPFKQFKHFLMQTEVYTSLLIRNKKHPGVFDYRDNLYCSYDYNYPEGNKIIRGTYRPDGEIQFDDNFYYVEVDMGTEKKPGLEKKFQNLRYYLQYLSSTNQPLPKGILFIRNPTSRKVNRNVLWTTKKRFQLMFDIFQTECKAYYDKVDFRYIEIQNLDTVLIEMLEDSKKKKVEEEMYTWINSVRNGKYTNIHSIKAQIENGFQLIHFKEGTTTKLFIFAPMEGYETLTWLKGQHMYDEMKGNFDEVFFVPYYHRLHPVPPVSPLEKNVTTKEELDFYTHVMYLNITSLQKPVWFDQDHNVIDVSPL